MKTNDDHFNFQGWTQYLERKQRVNELKQLELENEQLQLKSNLLRTDKPRMSSHRRRPSKKQSNKYDKSEANQVNSPKNKIDVDNSETLYNTNQLSHFGKDRKNSVIEKQEENLDFNANKKTRRMKNKQAIQTHRGADHHQRSPHLLNNSQIMHQNSDQKENIDKNKYLDNLQFHHVNSDSKNKNTSLIKENIKSHSPTSRNQRIANYKSNFPSERLYKKTEQIERPKQKPKEDQTFNMNYQKYSEQEMFSIYDTSGLLKDEKKYKMPSVFRNPKVNMNKSRNASNRNMMTPKVLKSNSSRITSGRVMSSSPEYNRIGRNGSIPSHSSNKKLNSYLSSQQIRFQDEVINHKNNKVAVYLTKVKPYFYLPKVDAHRTKLRVLKRGDKFRHSDNRINIESVNEYSKESHDEINN